MRRRTYLAAAGTAVFGGCLGSGATATPNATPVDGVESSPAPPAGTVLQYGDWHATAAADVTVTGAETTARLRGDASTPADVLPSGTKLVVVSGLLENATDEAVALADAGVSFGVVASDQLFEPVTPSSGELSAAIETHADASGTYLPAGDGRLDPDEQRTVWGAVLVPAGVSTADMQVALAGGADGGIRWQPSGKSCDCPG